MAVSSAPEKTPFELIFQFWQKETVIFFNLETVTNRFLVKFYASEQNRNRTKKNEKLPPLSYTVQSDDDLTLKAFHD